MSWLEQAAPGADWVILAVNTLAFLFLCYVDDYYYQAIVRTRVAYKDRPDAGLEQASERLPDELANQIESCVHKRLLEAVAPLQDLFGQTGPARRVCEAAGQGNLRAREAVARAGYFLGLGLVNLVTLFTTEVIALGGGVMQSGHLFWEKIHATIRQNCGLVPYEKTRLVPAALDKDGVLIGAAQAWVLRFG